MYFAYYIARGVLARDNTSNISAPDIAILATALSGRFDYNVGALIARCLAMNGNKGDLFGGVYATLILESLNGTPHPDDKPFTYLSFDLFEVFARFYFFHSLQKQQKDFLFSFALV